MIYYGDRKLKKGPKKLIKSKRNKNNRFQGFLLKILKMKFLFLYTIFNLKKFV